MLSGLAGEHVWKGLVNQIDYFACELNDDDPRGPLPREVRS